MAIVSATLAVSMTYYELPPIGYDGIIFVSSVAVMLAIGSPLLSFVPGCDTHGEGKVTKTCHRSRFIDSVSYRGVRLHLGSIII